MSHVDTGYTLSSTTKLGFTEAVARVRAELASEGFGVLCEIDVQATFKQKLDHAALQAEPELGVLLPCNVVIYTHAGQTHIAAVNAEQMLSIVGNDALSETASEVRRRLACVVERAASA